MRQLLLVGFGGFAGTIARFWISRLNLHFHFLSVPMGTLLVNVLGSLIIGFLIGISAKNELIPADIRLFLMAGFCGGFTTFSTFAGENLTLMQNGQFATVIIYTAGSILFGFLAVYIGYIISGLI